jgi:branched-chain amino acid transport system substrate-binding protein
VPIRSHWGITGGAFYESLNKVTRSSMDLEFIQTDFSFLSSTEHPMARKVVERARQLFSKEIQTAKDIQAPAGFVHAYDLTKLLISALKQINVHQPIKAVRQDLKTKLEAMSTPVSGLIKNYQHPFSPYQLNNKNGHEALSPSHYAMGFYDEEGVIHLNSDR